MNVETTSLPGVLLVRPRLFGDDRGTFFESWHQARYEELGLPTRWVQDNVSRSKRHVLRGLHFQHPGAQGKLLTVLAGEVLDVAVDVRRGSATFGQSLAIVLTAEAATQLYVPPGFAHGFLVLSVEAVFAYKCTEYYSPTTERTLLWNDPALGIEWPFTAPILARKDAEGRRLADFRPDELPPTP